MNITNERKLASYIKALGGNASAIGNLAGIVNSTASVDLLRPLLSDSQKKDYGSNQEYN